MTERVYGFLSDYYAMGISMLFNLGVDESVFKDKSYFEIQESVGKMLQSLDLHRYFSSY